MRLREGVTCSVSKSYLRREDAGLPTQGSLALKIRVSLLGQHTPTTLLATSSVWFSLSGPLGEGVVRDEREDILIFLFNIS